MKISIALSVLILATGAMFGWHDRQQLATARETHDKLAAEAAQFGVAIDPKKPADPVRLTKRRDRGERGNRDAEARLAAKDFIVFAKEMEAIETRGGPPDEATQKKILDTMDRMMSLDSAQLKILIAEIRASKELNDETRQGLIGFSIMTLANDHPKAALALFTESSDLFDGKGKHVISSSLAKWAKDDPAGALEWVKTNAVKFPDLVTDAAKRGIISGAAATDPALAFKLIGELGLKDTSQTMSSIINAAKTPEERNATLAALREHLGTIQDEKARNKARSSSISLMAEGIAQQGFESGSKWLVAAKLTPAELEGIAGGLTDNVKSAETGQWIEWIGASLPAGKSDRSIRDMLSQWTEKDYQAAGKWLGTTPAGPAKNISIRTYAETVSKYEPETAAQWAMTLPPGKDRDETLRHIHQNWPRDAAAAKDAFAKQHGIK